MSDIQELSLYHIDSELAALLDYRDERISDTEDPATAEEIAAVDGQIAVYMQALPAKVEGVAAMFRKWASQRQAVKDEIRRLSSIFDHIENKEKRLKSYVADILAMQPEPAEGCRKLVGNGGSVLMLKGNGGLAPLTVQEDILPEEFKKITVTLPLAVWNDINVADGWALNFKIEPDNTGIREALNAGLDVPGAHIEPRGTHVEVK